MEKEKIVENSAPRISSKFQTRLLEIIDDKNYKRTELASLIGISKDTISKATLYGIIPKVKSLIKIANFLNVSFNYLPKGTLNINIRLFSTAFINASL